MNLETFFKNFDFLADAPNGVQKLRELILQLAVMGKLVPQDANDEPASVLLEKIKGKEFLYSPNQKYETCKTSKNWILIEFKDVMELQHGHQFRKYDYVSEGIPVIKIGQCQANGTLDLLNCDYIAKERLEEFKDYKIYQGDILMALTGGTLGKVTVVNTDYGDVVQNYRVGKFIPNENLYTRGFTEIILKSQLFQNSVKDNVNQNAQPNIGKDKIEKLKVPLPPLAEQKRIVAKVDELMELCDRLSERQQKRRSTRIIINNAAIGQLLTAREPEVFNKSWQHICNNFDLLYSTPDNIGKLRQAILQLAVQGKLVPQDANDEPTSVLLEKIKLEKELLVKEGKIKKEKLLQTINIEQIPYEIPQGWKWIQLGEIAKTIEYGTSEKSSDIVDEVPVFRMNNIREGKVLFNNLKYVSTSIKDLPRLYLQEKDILFNRTNSYDLVGKTGVFTGVSNRYTFASYLIRIQLILNYISPELINIAMNSAYFRQTQIEPEITQQCGQANFNGTKLKNALIPLPPLAEQKRIVAKVNQLMSLCDALETKLTQSVTDSEKLMEAAVRQILAPNSNKTDIHESTLIETIHAEAAKL